MLTRFYRRYKVADCIKYRVMYMCVWACGIHEWLYLYYLAWHTHTHTYMNMYLRAAKVNTKWAFLANGSSSDSRSLHLGAGKLCWLKAFPESLKFMHTATYLLTCVWIYMCVWVLNTPNMRRLVTCVCMHTYLSECVLAVCSPLTSVPIFSLHS